MIFDMEINYMIGTTTGRYTDYVEQRMLRNLLEENDKNCYTIIIDKALAKWVGLPNIFYNNSYCDEILNRIKDSLQRQGFIVSIENLGKKRWFKKTTYNKTLVVSWRIA